MMSSGGGGPAPFDDAFLRDLPYDPEVLLFDRLLAVDQEQSLIRCRLQTHPDMPLTRAQRVDEAYHPRHLAAGLLVHATGMLGFIHAYYVLGLRHAEGWVGFGTHIHRATFRRLILPGQEAEASCRATRCRLGQTRHFIRYHIEVHQQAALCYQGDQSALWLRREAPGEVLRAAPGGEEKGAAEPVSE